MYIIVVKVIVCVSNEMEWKTNDFACIFTKFMFK